MSYDLSLWIFYYLGQASGREITRLEGLNFLRFLCIAFQKEITNLYYHEQCAEMPIILHYYIVVISIIVYYIVIYSCQYNLEYAVVTKNPPNLIV